VRRPFPSKSENILDEDAAAAADWMTEDPWQTVRRALNVVSLDAAGGDVVDRSSYPNDEIEEPDLTAAIRALRKAAVSVLTLQEETVLFLRIHNATYADVADMCDPPLSGPSQARKIEQRAMRKLGERLSRFSKLFVKKEDRP